MRNLPVMALSKNSGCFKIHRVELYFTTFLLSGVCSFFVPPECHKKVKVNRSGTEVASGLLFDCGASSSRREIQYFSCQTFFWQSRTTRLGSEFACTSPDNKVVYGATMLKCSGVGRCQLIITAISACSQVIVVAGGVLFLGCLLVPPSHSCK